MERTEKQNATPPSLWEIVLLPATAAAVIEAIHTKQNELILFFLPFLTAVIRLFLAQFQLPPVSADRKRQRAARNCVAINQFAVLVLILFQCVVVMAVDPTVPGAFWLVAAFFFAAYVGLRLLSRNFWIAAAGETVR